MPKVIDQLEEPARNIPVWYDVDVLVCGGGTAGVASAVCAGRLGLSVALMEMTGQPGGMVTHITTWLNDFDNKGGFAKEWLDHLTDTGVYEAPNYNPFAVIPYFDQLLAEANARPLYYSMVVAPLMEDATVKGAILETKSGRGAVRAKIVIDATGDGDVAARAGAEFKMGRDADGACQAISLNILLSNWNDMKIDRDIMRELALQAGRDAGTSYKLPYDHWGPKAITGISSLSYAAVPHATGYDATDVESLSDAMIELRRQSIELIDTLSKHTSEFSNVKAGPFSALPGVRESRRIITDTIVKKDDVLNGARFKDGLFMVAQNIDIHKTTATEPSIVVTKVKPYQLPYGALLPKGLENIMVIGRCIGGDHEALASYRIIADCFAMGEAAAIAAKKSIDANKSPREIDSREIRNEMTKKGYAINK